MKTKGKKSSKFSIYCSKVYNFIAATIRSFFKDECYLKAALLTFYTLIAIVPFLALTLAIAKGFGFETFLQEEILKTFKEQKVVLNTAIQFAYSLIQNIKSGLIVGLGVLFLFISIFGLLENIERALNDIWKIHRGRTFVKKAVDYLAILIICPIIFAISSSVTIFLSTEVSSTFENHPFLKELVSYFAFLIHFIPFFLSWVLFSFIYLFVPNTKIRFLPRIFAGILAGTFFQLWQIIYIEFQVTITSYNAVYGSFAALPLFLIWMQVNFLIFLYGAEIAAHIENETYLYRKARPRDHVIEVTPKTLALLILNELGQSFQKGEPPPTIFNISETVGIQVYIAREMLGILEKGGVVIEVSARISGEERYQLNINPKLLTVKKVADLVESQLEKKVFAKQSRPYALINKSFHNFDHLIENSKSNFTLEEIVHNLKK